jgi:Ser/Thr protein kinase RdoA (MazF antagonist)
MNYTDIQISSEEATQILEDIYGLKARVKELPGEIDFNFFCDTAEDEKLVLKVS